ncbi:MAG: hypothetical protein IJO43_02790 [Bacilli bacterium]|nr:hypothetical protein [Bacilli bacterium]
MKKFLLVITTVLLLVGCESVMNNPTKRVETFLNKYQTMDSEVLSQLDTTLNNDNTLTNEQKKEYKELMKKQYQNLTYTIKDEEVDGDTATVKVEIEVYDFNKAMTDSDNYLLENQDEFIDEENEIDNEKFMDYKINQMKNTKEKVKYTIDFTLTKENDQWMLDNVDEITRQKIHGIYNY